MRKGGPTLEYREGDPIVVEPTSNRFYPLAPAPFDTGSDAEHGC